MDSLDAFFTVVCFAKYVCLSVLQAFIYIENLTNYLEIHINVYKNLQEDKFVDQFSNILSHVHLEYLKKC
jgi:hypothetical protein